MLQRETEKLRTDIDKMRSELRYEIDKVTAGQRLDLNLERGRIRDELANQNAETTNLTNKLDREIHGLRAQLEAAKYDVIKYCIGTLISISAEHHFSMLQRETEKLRTDIDKMRSELRYEIDKVTAGQRLDLNLERGRIRDELANQNAETTNLTNKLDREIHGLRAQLEAAKYDVIKYCIGTL
nr:protein FMP32, mitochondrial-like [Tanacetum cinerariifolium]